MIELTFILLLLIGLTQISIHRNRFISPLLAIPLTIYILFWNVFPFLYSTLMSDRTGNIISNPTYQKVIVIQLISVFFVLILLNIFANFLSKLQQLPCPQQKNTNANMILVLLVISFIFLLFTHIHSIITIGLTFFERVQYTVSESNKKNAVGAFLSALNNYTVPFAIACIFSRIHTLRKNRWIMRFSIAIIAIHICFMIIFGMRSYILLPIELIVLYWNVNTQKLGRIAKIAMVASMFTLLLVAPFLSRTLKTIRDMESYSPRDLLVMYPSDVFSTVGEYCLSALDDSHTKFNSFKNGTDLLEIEGMSRVGLSLITSSLTSPIPRVLYNEKPVPFSSDGEYTGVPYYLVPRLQGLVLPGNVVPIPPSAIALWELGYIGIFMMIVTNVVFLLFMNTFLKSKLLLYKAMGFFMLSMPTFEFLLAPTGWMIKEGLRVFALIFLIRFLFLIRQSMRNVLGHQKLTSSRVQNAY